MRKIILYGFLLLAAFGCSKERHDDPGQQSEVILPVNSLYKSSAAATRAIDGPQGLDNWNNTLVALAYHIPPEIIYTNYVGVVVTTDADQVIHTGMVYPADGTNVYVRGYYPAQTPTASGVVNYDISKGNVDVMASHEVFGNNVAATTILAKGVKLQFQHKMTRLTFSLQCLPGKSYPDRVAGIMIGGTKTWGTLNLTTGTMGYSIPGSIFAGSPDGYAVPADYETPVILDAIVQPGVPLTIEVLTVGNGTIPITLTSLPTIHTAGGDQGKQYKINLNFTGTTILAGDISVVLWENKNPFSTQTWW